MKTSDTELS